MSEDETDYIDTASFYSIVQPAPPLNPVERRRRVVMLCSSFLRNLAFHRAGLDRRVQRALLMSPHPQFEFWREAHVNFLDVCVLEWCKLFADRRGQHHWRRIIDIDDHDGVEADLYRRLSVTPDEFAKLIEKAKHYRDKFIAHLDEERIMRLPNLELAKKSVVFLYGRLVQRATAERLDQDFTQALQKARTRL
jgi:hypothetical protein